MTSFKPPAEFSPGPFPAEDWERWRQRFEVYYEAAEIGTKGVQQQRAILLHVIGDIGIQLYNTFTFAQNGDDRTVTVILDTFSAYYEPHRNITYKRYVFFTHMQGESQSIDQFVTDLKARAKDCEFGALADSLIRDRLVVGIRDESLRERLLREANLTLTMAVDICRADEASKYQNKSMHLAEGSTVHDIKPVNSLNTYNRFQNNKIQQRDFVDPTKRNRVDQRACSRCNGYHQPRRCPAFGKKCMKCGLSNHYASVCRRYTVHEMEDQDPENLPIGNLFVGTLILNEITKQSTEWTETAQILDRNVQFKLDTGAQVNIISEKEYQQLKNPPPLRTTKQIITTYSGHNLKIKGTCQLPCKVRNRTAECKFYIIDTLAPSILGLTACEQLQLVQRLSAISKVLINNSTPESIIEDYADVFQGIGCLEGEHKIHVNDQISPTIAATRKIPIHLMEKVKLELQKMVDNNIIVKEDGPTDWVNPIVVVQKPDGNIRLCMDPRDLNQAIKREHFQIPTPEEIFAKLKGAKYFTVLDASCAFWQVALDEESSRLCTITTPFGRYRFLRMPYGIKSAPEVFQKKIEHTLEGLVGNGPYFDDILVWGNTLDEHNQRLIQTLQRARERNLKLKKEKLQLAVTEIQYLGYTITPEGIKIDKTKTEAIQAMNPPTNQIELKRFFGMLTFLTKHIPNMAEKATNLRTLLKERTPWLWDSNMQTEFEKLKMSITAAPVLSFFDIEKESVLSVDASQHGLGCVLLQEGRPIAYGSATLTQTQVRYAQIEKELLAIVYGCEHFHYYIYGKYITVHTDHKPLLGIIKKPLDDLSPRLQRLVLRLQRYQIKLIHVPGKQMYVSDALSRDPDKTKLVNTDYLDNNTANVHLLISATEARTTQIRESTKLDKTLQEVSQYVKLGWPGRKADTTEGARSYWECQGELHEENGLLFRGSKLIIPVGERRDILKKIHCTHQGVVSCKNKAKTGLYWPGMCRDIEVMVLGCSICQAHYSANQKEPTMLHDIPTRPWEKVGTDFMKVNNQNYLVLVDYFSKYPEIQLLSNTSATPVITALKSIFARHGIAQQVMTDNGPPFNSAEFANFAKNWDFEHHTSSPYHPKSNGMIERHIQTIKNQIVKAIEGKEDPYSVLLELRTTPKENLPSPAEMLMGRRLRAKLPIPNNLLNPHYSTEAIHREHQGNQDRQKSYADLHSKKLKPFQQNDKVLLYKGQRNWIPAKITDTTQYPRSYIVTTPEGASYRRNRVQLRSSRTELSNEEANTSSGEAETPEQSHQPSDAIESIPTTETNINNNVASSSNEDSPNIRTFMESQRGTFSRSGRQIRRPNRFQD